MEKIRWEAYNSSDFQTFCNALLSFEISKTYIPFNAPGKDMGWDGRFEGEYANHKGLWRFQYKFHQTARKQAYSTIKSELKNELDKITNEDNLVLITNVETLPQEREELISIVNQFFDKKKTSPVHFEIWDGAKLNNIALRYPILRIWLDDRFSTSQLQPFEKDKFEAHNKISEFIGRDKELAILHDFTTSEDRFLLVSGEAGIGKTTLCIEFFEQLKENDNWQILILSSFTIDFDRINLALSGDKNYLIFIDDAHQYPAEVIGNFYKLASLRKENTVKVILTARSIFNEYLKFIKEFQQLQIPNIDLSRLAPGETKAILEKSLAQTYLSRYIDELITISRGSPILITSIINAAQSKTNISELKKNDFLTKYVTTYFDELIGAVAKETGEQNGKLKNLLRTICFIEPIEYKNASLQKLLSEKEEISIETVEVFLNKLIKYSLVIGKNEYSIKPDYYSDIYLSTTTDLWIQRSLEKYEEYINNIIPNLVSIDEVENKNERTTSVINSLLNFYITKIEKVVYSSELSSLFKTIESISYPKPYYAIEAVKSFIKIANDKEHVLYSQLQNDAKSKHAFQYGYYPHIKTILYNTSYYSDYYSATVDLLIDIYKLTQESSIFNSVLGYSKRDSNEHYHLGAQNYYVDYTQKLLNDEKSELTSFILSSYKELLKLSYISATTSFVNVNEISLVTYYIYDTDSVISMRAKIIENLVEFFSNSRSKENRLLALDMILDIPREIIATRREKKLYTGKTEIDRIISFLLELSKTSIEIQFQQKILERLYWFRKWEITAHAVDKITEIEDNLQPSTLAEKLIKIFTKTSEDIDLGFDVLQKKFRTEASEIIEKNNAIDIYTALNDIYQNYKQLPHHYSDFIGIILNYPEKAKEIFLLAFSTNKKFIIEWGVVFLRVLRFRYKEHDFFWKYVNLILEWDNTEAYNSILFIYQYRIDKEERTQITSDDVKLIKTIYHRNTPETYHYLSYSLPCLINVNEEEALKVMGDFLEKCSQSNADNLISFLLSYYKEYYKTIKTLVLHHTQKHEISYHIEKSLTHILNTEWSKVGFDEVFNYLLERHKVLMDKVEKKEGYFHYDFVPISEKTNLLNDRTINEKNAVYKDALLWFLEQPNDYGKMYLNSKLLNYLQPSNYITSELKSIYDELLKVNTENSENIYKLVQSLEIFHDKSPELVSVLINALSVAELKFKNTEIYNDIVSSCYTALTALGGKSGTAGQPFQVDLDLKDFLMEQLKEHDDNPVIKTILQNALKSVERDINDERYYGDNTW